MAIDQTQVLETDRIRCPRCGEDNYLNDRNCASCRYPLRPEAAKRLMAAPAPGRLIAAAIDATIVLGAGFVLSVLLDGLIRLLNGDNDYLFTGVGLGILFGAVVMIVAMAYYISFHVRLGTTPGKMRNCGIRVTW